LHALRRDLEARLELRRSRRTTERAREHGCEPHDQAHGAERGEYDENGASSQGGSSQPALVRGIT
jgi:hypothetical protein